MISLVIVFDFVEKQFAQTVASDYKINMVVDIKAYYIN
jgi:hypothetical protein